MERESIICVTARIINLYLYHSAISLLEISGRSSSKTDTECARLYNRYSLRVHLVSSFKHIYSFARFRVASSRQINFDESLVHTIIECALPPFLLARPSFVSLETIPPITIPRVRKIENRPCAAVVICSSTIIFAPLNREFVKNSSLTAREESWNFINIQRIDSTSDRQRAPSIFSFSAEIANCESKIQDETF